MSCQYWGAYCPLPQEHARYVHVVYPTARVLVRVGGVIREVTDAAELDALTAYRRALAESFTEEEL